jgi:hypothetical protein
MRASPPIERVSEDHPFDDKERDRKLGPPRFGAVACPWAVNQAG